MLPPSGAFSIGQPRVMITPPGPSGQKYGFAASLPNW